MAIDYTKMAATAARLLAPPPKGNGMPMWLRRTTVGGYDSESQQTTGSTFVDMLTSGLWQDRSEDWQVTARGLGGVVKVSDIEYEDRQAVISAQVAPKLDDKLVIFFADGGTKYLGEWNAATNTPTLSSGVGAKGGFYIVSVAGATVLDGIGPWTNKGQALLFNGTAWVIVENQTEVWQILSEPKIIKPATIPIAYLLQTRK